MKPGVCRWRRRVRLVSLCLAVAAAPALAQPAPDAGVARGKIEVAGAAGDAAAAPLARSASTPGEAFEYTLRLEEVGGAAVDKLELSVTPLEDDRGAQHALPWRLDGETTEHSGRAVVAQPAMASTVYVVVLRATLTELGTYKASITPFWDGVPHQKIALTVTRASRPALNLDVPDPDPITKTGDLDKVAFETLLQATEARGLSLGPPVLRSLVEVRGADTSARRLRAPGTLTVKDGNTVVDARGGIVLRPHTPRPVAFELAGLPGPGHYEATIRFASQDAPPLDKTFPIYLRQSGWIAFLWIFGGVVLSWFLRWFVISERPRVANQQIVLGLISDLKESLELPDIDEDGRGLVSSVRRDLRGCLGDFLVRLDARDQKRIELLGLKVQLVRKWLLLHPSVRAIASPGVRAEHQRTLDAIAGDIRGSGADADQLKADSTTLDGLPAAIRSAVDKDLAERAAALRTDLETAAASLPDGRLRIELQNIRVRLASGAASFEALTAAQKDFVLALANDLRGRLEQPRPAYVADAAWLETVSAVRGLLAPVAQLEPTAAREIYRVAYGEFLHRLSAAEGRILDNARTRKLLDDKSLEALSQRLDAAVAALAGGKLEQADSLIAAFGVEILATPLGQQMAGGQPPPPSLQAQPAMPAMPEFGPMSQFHAPTLVAIEDLAARRVRRAPAIEILVNALVLGVAGILGMKFLYFDDLIWGGWSGYLTAALWGLGLHQFTYAGVGGLFDRFTGGGASAGAGAS